MTGNPAHPKPANLLYLAISLFAAKDWKKEANSGTTLTHKAGLGRIRKNNAHQYSLCLRGYLMQYEDRMRIGAWSRCVYIGRMLQ